MENRKRAQVNPKTGEIDLKYDPMLTTEDFYLGQRDESLPFMKVKDWLKIKELKKKIITTQDKLDIVSNYVSQGVSVKWVVENIIGKKYEGGDKGSKD